MTKWEIGQELIKITDLIYEAECDFQREHFDLTVELKKIRARIGDLFLDNNDHSFGIFNSKDLK